MKTLMLTFTLILATALSASAIDVETTVPALFGGLQSGFAPWTYSNISNLIQFADGAGTCESGEDYIASFPPQATAAIIELATNDLIYKVTGKEHISCIVYLINYLKANKPNVTRVVVVNAPPTADVNYYGITADQVKSYNTYYAMLPGEYPGYVIVADVWSQIVQSDGYAQPPFMNGTYGVIFGQPKLPSVNWEFFFRQIRGAL